MRETSKMTRNTGLEHSTASYTSASSKNTWESRRITKDQAKARSGWKMAQDRTEVGLRTLFTGKGDSSNPTAIFTKGSGNMVRKQVRGC